MSYVRWSNESLHGYESSLYIYDSRQGITCCGCLFNEDDASFRCQTVDEMVAHVERHIAAGHDVPDFVISRLKAGQNYN